MALQKVMAAAERAERLRKIQTEAHHEVGRVFTPDEVNDLVKETLATRG